MTTTNSPTASEIRSNLRQATGSQELTRWSFIFRNCFLTEGTHYLAQAAGAYWLMDAIASYQGEQWAKREDFQLWVLNSDSSGWKLVCGDGNGTVLASQAIEYTDFPLPEGIKLYATRNDKGGVTIMLPSEY